VTDERKHRYRKYIVIVTLGLLAVWAGWSTFSFTQKPHRSSNYNVDLIFGASYTVLVTIAFVWAAGSSSFFRRRLLFPFVAVYLALGLLACRMLYAALRGDAEETATWWVQRFVDQLGAATAAVGTCSIAVIGYALYRLKLWHPLVYARAEIGFALVSCYLAFDRMRLGIDLAGFSVVAASAYLMVRGLDNRKKARDAERLEKKPLVADTEFVLKE
jgi:hypothetical protein